MPLLEIERLVVRYGEMEAVRSATLSVAEGEAVAVIGPNGAGKTTTLKALMGLVAPTAGIIRYAGTPLGGLAPWERAARGIAWVPEGRRIFPDLTVAENLRLGAHARRASETFGADLARVFALFPVLEERARQLGRTLSGGEQQMLALGRALIARPRLLLVDEASLGLAPVYVTRVFAAMATLVREGLTLLLVEQNARQALQLVRRAYVLEAGHIVRAGSAQDLLADPAVQATYLGT